MFGATGEDAAPKTRAHPAITPRRNPLTHASPTKTPAATADAAKSKPLGAIQDTAFAVPEPVGVVKKLSRPKPSEFAPKDSLKSTIYGMNASPDKPKGRKSECL